MLHYWTTSVTSWIVQEGPRFEPNIPHYFAGNIIIL